MGEPTCALADDTGTVHTPTMTLKNAALLALIGTILKLSWFGASSSTS